MSNSGKPTQYSLETYIPDERQVRYAAELLKITSICEREKITYAVGGGYGLDGLYGKLTRSHDDIDMLVLDSDVLKLQEVLESLGYVQAKYEKDSDKVVYKNSEFPESFKVEFASHKLLANYGTNVFEDFFPDKPNAHIGEYTFRSIPTVGVRKIIEIQNTRAREQQWNEYPVEKRDNQKAILEVLK